MEDTSGDLRKKLKRNKARGTEWETALVTYFRYRGKEIGATAERLRLAGRDDEGDVAVHIPTTKDPVVIVEAKAPGKGKPIDLSGWLREAETEAANYARRRELGDRPLPVVVIKAANKPVDQAYVVMRLKEFFGT
jgi:hypothetical protein